MNTVMGCRPVSSRFITIRLRALPCNITVIQTYAPTSDYEVEEFYDQLKNVIDRTPKKDVLVVQGDRNVKVSKDAYNNWQGICEPLCNDDANKRGLRFLEFATFTILRWRTLLVITKRPEDGPGIVKKDNTITKLITFL